MPINSKRKGARAELELCHELKAIGVDAHRSCQYMGGHDSADIKSKLPIHFEVKHVEKLNIYNAMAQAVKDAGPNGQVPVVVHRKNRSEWLLTFQLKDIFKFLEAWDKK